MNYCVYLILKNTINGISQPHLEYIYKLLVLPFKSYIKGISWCYEDMYTYLIRSKWLLHVSIPQKPRNRKYHRWPECSNSWLIRQDLWFTVKDMIYVCPIVLMSAAYHMMYSTYSAIGRTLEPVYIKIKKNTPVRKSLGNWGLSCTIQGAK